MDTKFKRKFSNRSSSEENRHPHWSKNVINENSSSIKSENNDEKFKDAKTLYQDIVNNT